MSTIEHNIIIPEALQGLRLDQALAKLIPEYSRSQLQQWIKSGQVSVNRDIQTHVRYAVQAEDEIYLHATLTAQSDWQAQALPLTIVYEDDDIIVINKSAGLTVHPGAGNPDQTLVNALLHHDQRLEHVPRAGLVHRLDKDTTGLLVVARTLAAHNQLVQALQAREIKREYQALVNGTIISGNTVDAAIGRHPRKRTLMAVVPGGKPAVTHYRVLEKFPAHTLLRLQLETGRTHQIRVHMQHIKHPIVGDPIYGKWYFPNKISNRDSDRFHSEKFETAKQLFLDFKRQALLAWRLSLAHPVSGEILSWEAPLPDDMQAIVSALRDLSD